MRKRYDTGYEDRESFSPWETYSDLYCGLLLVFVLLFFFSIYQYIDARERNNAETAALQDSMREEQASVLALYKATLEDQEAAYQEKNQELENQKTALAILRSDLDDQQERISDQEEQLEEQKKLIGEQQALLDSQAEQIEQIVGIRGQLIDELNTELAVNQIQIQADKQTGAIAFASTVLFAKDDYELSEEGKSFFRSFMPVYMGVLLQPDFRQHIAEVIIEGHTDSNGSYFHNLELSQRRAGSVAEYILGDAGGFLEQETVEALKTLVTVNGCADKDPVYREDGSIDQDNSRRVEIKFRLRDQEMIQEMDEILNK